MRLAELLNKVKAIQVSGNAESIEIENISIDSRTSGKNTLFFAIEGEKTDGHKFIPDVINKGAAAVVLQNAGSVPVRTQKASPYIFLYANQESLSTVS